MIDISLSAWDKVVNKINSFYFTLLQRYSKIFKFLNGKTHFLIQVLSLSPWLSPIPTPLQKEYFLKLMELNGLRQTGMEFNVF